MEKTLSIVRVLLSIALLISVGALLLKDNNALSADEIASNVAGKIVIPEANVTTVVENNSKLDELYDDYFKARDDKAELNDTAKSLVYDEIAKKAFKRELLNKLNENVSIDELSDLKIDSFKILKSELSRRGNRATVEIELKTSFIEFGDEDEASKATVKVVFNVIGLDLDELEDAEVDSYTIEVLRIRTI